MIDIDTVNFFFFFFFFFFLENPEPVPGGCENDTGRSLHGQHRIHLSSQHQPGHRNADRGIRKGHAAEGIQLEHQPWNKS